MMDIAKFIDGLTLWFSKEIAPIVVRISALESRQPEKGEKGDPGRDFDPTALVGMFVSAEKTLTQKVDDFLKSVPLPENGKDGADGVDGKDADITLTTQLLELKFDALQKSISIPKDGLDGKDGKDADPEFIKQLVIDQVAQKIAEIPPAKDGIDGKNVEIEQVKALVDEVFAQIPPPKDGKDGVSVDIEQVKQLIVDEVAKIPVPENGKDPDPEVIKAMVDEAVSAIPVPQNGKDGESVDIEQVREMVSGEFSNQFMFQNSELKTLCDNLVKAAISEIPPAKDGIDGKDADLSDVKAMIQAEISNIPPVETLSEDEIKALATVAASEVLKNIELPSDGKDGKDGENGRDALDIEILPAIDETKTYPRGTYAQHKKGLWKSFQKTHGMRGWECIVSGVADVVIEKLDDRNFSIKTIFSTGETTEKGFSMLNTIYKGVYKEGFNAEKGDLITWGGNIWHCNIPTTLKPREGIEEWTLAVKRGRDYVAPVDLPPKRDPKAPVKLS